MTRFVFWMLSLIGVTICFWGVGGGVVWINIDWDFEILSSFVIPWGVEH